MKKTFHLISHLLSYAVVVSWALGIACNKLVEFTNAGLMPVMGVDVCQLFPGARFDRIHICALPTSRLLFLADRFQMAGGDEIWSLGDFFISGAEHIVIVTVLLLLANLLVQRFAKD